MFYILKSWGVQKMGMNVLALQVKPSKGSEVQVFWNGLPRQQELRRGSEVLGIADENLLIHSFPQWWCCATPPPE
jgi:hypothetical protein